MWHLEKLKIKFCKKTNILSRFKSSEKVLHRLLSSNHAKGEKYADCSSHRPGNVAYIAWMSTMIDMIDRISNDRKFFMIDMR